MIDLVCHPQTPCPAIRSLQARVSRAPRGLAVRYRIEGDLASLRIPARRAPAPGERLWQHTCCEPFVGRPEGTAYREFNFSPSGEWAAYAFERYREGGPLPAPDPMIEVRRGDDSMELGAQVEAAAQKLLLAISAVIEGRDGTLSYWALRHPAGKPDFHHREAFALELA